jgi:hypothetical protein
LRQGDPLSPVLFNILVDMLAVLIERSNDHDIIRGLVPHLVDGSLSILQYADDTILFLEDDVRKANNLKQILCAFENLSGLKINFHKSEILCFGKTKEKADQYVGLFGCKERKMPFRYMGISMSHKKIVNSDWIEVEERFQKKLSSWKGKVL